MITQTYAVEGMTCGHCAAAVTREVSGVEGVSSVDVDVTAGAVTVQADALRDDAVAAAVDAAGYTFAGRR